ncbi:5-oxoprolinase subunit PxpA [Palleronia sp. LCG004]|uniref:LamB/YcsF family protein n=1 Tax=Palleronia sp. LCG004 TaxID=3079304 RepID=UPI002942C285|nr:5-oxoprolinase subunit PxpA [Palleronia sp. LCG004]WOI57409.1 5-oxoprolinase subunit PxpA [Palleronia sp. LCG004]
MTTVDLNADMGESFGPWKMGDDTALLDVISSANIACGFHAGDPDVMAATMARAVANDVGIGAHPGFPDLQGFGRRKMAMDHDAIAHMVQYQLGAAQAMARATGGHVRHLKLHGALSNMAMVDGELARRAYDAALTVDPDIIIMVLAATPMQEAAEALGCRMACEIFADRGYNDDGTLIQRGQPGAMITDAEAAAERISEMVREGAIIASSGHRIETRIDTICLHGDEPSAVNAARVLRTRLEADGISISRF